MRLAIAILRFSSIHPIFGNQAFGESLVAEPEGVLSSKVEGRFSITCGSINLGGFGEELQNQRDKVVGMEAFRLRFGGQMQQSYPSIMPDSEIWSLVGCRQVENKP